MMFLISINDMTIPTYCSKFSLSLSLLASFVISASSASLVFFPIPIQASINSKMCHFNSSNLTFFYILHSIFILPVQSAHCHQINNCEGQYLLCYSPEKLFCLSIYYKMKSKLPNMTCNILYNHFQIFLSYMIYYFTPLHILNYNQILSFLCSPATFSLLITFYFQNRLYLS